MLEVAYGQSNDPNLPAVDLPSVSAPPPPPPLKLTIHPNTQKTSFWDSLPDATSATSSAASSESHAPAQESKGDIGKFWDSLPDAPLPPPTKPPLGEDIGVTLAKNTIPTAIVGRINWPSDLANMAYHGGQYLGNQMRDQPLTGEAYSQMMSKQPLFGSNEIAQNAEKAIGVEPYDPQYNTTKFLNTIGQTVLTRNPVGGPAITIPKALSVGAGAGAAQLIAPDSALAPLAGGIAAAVLHQPMATGFAGVKNIANNVGVGQKVMSIPGGPSVTSGQVQQATHNILQASTNPSQILPALQQNTAGGKSQFLPGSNPTMAEVVPDQGLAQYQDAARTNNPPPFQARSEEQGTARAKTLSDVSAQGNPQTVGEFFTSKLKAAEEADAVREKQLQETSSQKAASIGRYGELPSEGATRDTAKNAQMVRKEHEESVWSPLNKYENAKADLETPRKAANELIKSTKEYGASPLSNAEKGLYSDILKIPAEERLDNFGALKRFRTRIGDAQREVGYGTQAYRRLSILKNAIDKGVENTVNGISEGEKAGSSSFTKEAKAQYNTARKTTFENKVLSDLENSGIVDPDGNINPAKYEKWRIKNRNKFKDHSGFEEKLNDWASAQKELEDFRAEKVRQQKDYNNSQASKFLDGRDPVAEVARIFSKRTTSQKEFADLVTRMKSDPAALAGLKSAVAEHILNISKTELEDINGITSGKISRETDLRNFIKLHRKALSEVYGNSKDMQALESVSADIKRTQQMFARAKLKGQSNTAKDSAQAAKQSGGNGSLFSRMLEHAPIIGGILGVFSGHAAPGFVVGEAVKAISGFRSKNLNTVKAIELEMLMHPSTFGKSMLEQVSAKEVPIPIWKRISKMLMDSVPQEAIASSNKQKHQ